MKTKLLLSGLSLAALATLIALVSLLGEVHSGKPWATALVIGFLSCSTIFVGAVFPKGE